ncbi:MAG TPA: EMC3/TMCO1 family protein [Candidatus Binatus sp.]|nr:EMC3/TMCO1 family protein [Candidatus Binatus sp.]
MSIIDDLLKTLITPLKPFTDNCPTNCSPDTIIARALIVLGAAFVLSLTSTLANRFLVDYKMVNSYRREYMTWMKAVNKARKDGDEKQLDKLMRRQGAVMRMNTRASLESLKTMPVTLVPFYLIYTVVRLAFGDLAVSFAPFYLPWASVLPSQMAVVLTLFYWYLICSFTISIPLSRIFGVNTFSMTGGMGGGDSKQP